MNEYQFLDSNVYSQGLFVPEAEPGLSKETFMGLFKVLYD